MYIVLQLIMHVSKGTAIAPISASLYRILEEWSVWGESVPVLLGWSWMRTWGPVNRMRRCSRRRSAGQASSPATTSAACRPPSPVTKKMIVWITQMKRTAQEVCCFIRQNRKITKYRKIFITTLFSQEKLVVLNISSVIITDALTWSGNVMETMIVVTAQMNLVVVSIPARFSFSIPIISDAKLCLVCHGILYLCWLLSFKPFSLISANKTCGPTQFRCNNTLCINLRYKYGLSGLKYALFCRGVVMKLTFLWALTMGPGTSICRAITRTLELVACFCVTEKQIHVKECDISLYIFLLAGKWFSNDQLILCIQDWKSENIVLFFVCLYNCLSVSACNWAVTVELWNMYLLRLHERSSSDIHAYRRSWPSINPLH